MARHEGGFRPTAEEPLSLDELLALLDGEGHHSSRARHEAIACFLSAGEGWREAVKKLGGAFAEEEAGLRERKAD